MSARYKASENMKITGRKTPQAGAVGPLGTPPAAGEANQPEAPEPISDQVDLTSTAEIREHGAAVRAMPSVRIEKVEGLRDAIDDGQYHVESEKLARKVVDDALSDIVANRLQASQGS